MKMILSGGLVAPTTSVPPMNQKPPTQTIEVQPDDESEPAKEAEPEREPVRLAELPRAEDFDSGDTEILAQAMGMEPRTRRWLPWKKKG